MSTPMNFTASDVYHLAPGVSALALIDQINARQCQLDGLLLMACGNAFDAFQELPDRAQDSHLGLCSMLSSEIRELTHHLWNIHVSTKESQS